MKMEAILLNWGWDRWFEVGNWDCVLSCFSCENEGYVCTTYQCMWLTFPKIGEMCYRSDYGEEGWYIKNVGHKTFGLHLVHFFFLELDTVLDKY